MEKSEIKKTLEKLVEIDEDAKAKLQQQAELREAYDAYMEKKKDDIDAYYNKLYEKETKEFYNKEIKEVLQIERQVEKSTIKEKEKLAKKIDARKSAIIEKLFRYMTEGGNL